MAENAVVERLKQLDITAMTPIEAIQQLEFLQKKRFWIVL